MFNIIGMDIRRMLKSKAAYVVLGVMLAGMVGAGAVLYIFSHQEAMDALQRAGMINSGDGKAVSFADMQILDFISEAGINGGFYSIALGIFAVLFTSVDYSGGAVKNILTAQGGRWRYWAARMISLTLYSLFCQTLIFGSGFLAAQVFGLDFTPSSLPEVFRYFLAVWLIHIVYLAITQFVTVLTRSPGFGIGVSILVFSGLASMLILQFFMIFGWDISNISLTVSYLNLTPYTEAAALGRILVLAGAWFVIYAAGGLAAMYQKDVV